MNDWGYVIVGWLVTGVTIATYWGWVARSARRAAADVARLEETA